MFSQKIKFHHKEENITLFDLWTAICPQEETLKNNNKTHSKNYQDAPSVKFRPKTNNVRV